MGWPLWSACCGLLSVVCLQVARAADPFAEFWDEVNRSEVIFVVPSEGMESPKASSVRGERTKDEAKDVALNRHIVVQKIVWMDGHWIREGQGFGPAATQEELRDSDGDGFDDFTEVKYHTDPMDYDSTPAHYFEAKGKKRVLFFTTNTTAHSR